MRQHTLIVAFVLLVATLPGAARGEIVNGSFEDSPDFDGWTLFEDPPFDPGNPLPNFNNASNVVINSNGLLATDGSRFAEIQSDLFFAPVPGSPLESISSLSQEFTALQGDTLEFDYFAKGASQLSGVAIAGADLTNLTTATPALQLFERRAALPTSDFSTEDWVEFSHPITESAIYRLTFHTSVTVDVNSFGSDGTATLDVDNVRLIGPSLLSDLTGDGLVDFADLTILLANWNSGMTVAEGNIVLTDTTSVDFQDLTALLADWTGSGGGGSPPAGDPLAVPEPSGLPLALIGMLGLSGFVRRSVSPRRYRRICQRARRHLYCHVVLTSDPRPA